MSTLPKFLYELSPMGLRPVVVSSWWALLGAMRARLFPI